MNKGYTNCGASVKPAQMSKGGYMTKKKPAYNMGGMVTKPAKDKTMGGASGNMSIKNKWPKTPTKEWPTMDPITIISGATMAFNAIKKALA